MSKLQNIILAAIIIAAFAIALIALSGAPAVAPPAATEAASAPAESPAEAQPAVSIALSEYRVLLSWDAIEGAESYRVTCDDGSGMADFATSKVTSIRKKGLKGGTAYTFAIQGVRKQDGEEVLVGDPLTVSGRTLPDIPTVKAKRSGDTCTLSWEAVEGADVYTVESSADGELWYDEGETAGTEYTLTADGADVYIAVRAVIHDPAGDIVSDYEKILLTKRKQTGKLLSYGDSVAVGVGSHFYSYADIYAQEHALTLVDKSTTGAQLASYDPKKQHIAESVIKEVKDDCDYLIIEGGNNDFFFNAPLGEVTPEWNTYDFDMKTTCGALEAAFSYLEDNCPDTKVVFVLIHRRDVPANDLGLTFDDYGAAIREVCDKYDVPIADVLKENKLDACDPEMCSEYTFHFNEVYPDGDGVHPSEEAYRKFYLPLIEKALK